MPPPKDLCPHLQHRKRFPVQLFSVFSFPLCIWPFSASCTSQLGLQTHQREFLGPSVLYMYLSFPRRRSARGPGGDTPLAVQLPPGAHSIHTFSRTRIAINYRELKTQASRPQDSRAGLAATQLAALGGGTQAAQTHGWRLQMCPLPALHACALFPVSCALLKSVSRRSASLPCAIGLELSGPRALLGFGY